MKLLGLPGSDLLDVDLEVETPGLVQAGDTTKIRIKVMPPDPQPVDSFKNMEIFIGIQTVDSLFFGPPPDTTVDLTRIGSSLADAELRRLSGKFGQDPINRCSEGVWQCAKIGLDDGFVFEPSIFVDGFESGDVLRWSISVAADNSKKKTEEVLVGVLNEDKKLPVLTAEELAEAMELFNDDDFFDEKTIGLVSDSFGVLKQLPPHRGQYFFDEFESFRKDGSQAPVTIYGNNCPSPCSGLVMQGAGGGVNGIRFEGFPDYGLVLEADSLFITRSEFVGNGAGGVQITGGIGDILGNERELGNHFEGNRGPGIVVEGGSGHAFKFNTFTANDGLAIDLGGDGVTANDPGDVDTGPNDLQNFPVLSDVLLDASGTLVEGSLNSIAGTIYTLQFYANDACDPSGNGEGAVFLGETEVTTDANGDASFSLTVEAAARGQFVTATATDPVSTSEFSACFEIVTGVATEDEPGVPKEFALDQNYPNPFNPATTITYAVPEASQVRLEVFDLLGRLVVVLVDEMKAAGSYKIFFDASALSSGVYFYKMTGERFSQTKTLLLLK